MSDSSHSPCSECGHDHGHAHGHGHGDAHGHGHGHGHGEITVSNAGAERRLSWAFWLTAVFMVAELVVGHLSHSVALTADGYHMASHALALLVALYAHKHAKAFDGDPSYCFGTGKVSSLAGFASAIALGFATLGMVWEAVERWLEPKPIAFESAVFVALLGLALNLVTAFTLGHGDHHEHDHNIKAAYFHVLADALTSVLAIVALIGAKMLGALWLDPLVALVGAFMVLRWAMSLLRETSRVLLDRAPDPAVLARTRELLGATDDVEVRNLVVWSIGAGAYAAHASLSVRKPESPETFRQKLLQSKELKHVSVEIHHEQNRN